MEPQADVHILQNTFTAICTTLQR